MKLSVTTFRAGAQRLTTLWQTNQTKPLSQGASRLNLPTCSDAEDDDDIESLIPREATVWTHLTSAIKRRWNPELQEVSPRWGCHR
ncbi:hypothetical protein TNIN_213221 [Trichonephila inaurata madagascariensis]|uniref:Uncharacterized protein n=1 Tax=Trichonephila inaurata madagascariensis TaxID=2747483 RepID=A0A8X6Y0A9_9ARAC|nr:hypothetical protein TNIN_213221 [Trichonephila inaurata madagascariensis]